MRQNLTNIAAKDLESLEHFYIVGSTTKEGLLDESTNVKIDLKKELAEAGGGGEEGGSFNIDDIILADDLLEKCRALDFSVDNTVATDWTFSDICIQDSNGLLQLAFEEVEVEGYFVRRSICIIDAPKGLGVDNNRKQQIVVNDADNDLAYYIYYDTGEGIYYVFERSTVS